MLESILGVEGGVRYTEEDYRNMHKQTDIQYTYNRRDNTITVNGPFTFWSNGYMYHFVGDETFEINGGQSAFFMDECYYALVVRKEPSTSLPLQGSAYVELVKKQDYADGVIDVNCLYEDQILQIHFTGNTSTGQYRDVRIYDVRDKRKPRRYIGYGELLDPTIGSYYVNGDFRRGLTHSGLVTMLNKLENDESVILHAESIRVDQYYTLTNSGYGFVTVTKDAHVRDRSIGVIKAFTLDVESIFYEQSKFGMYTSYHKSGELVLDANGGYSINVGTMEFTLPYTEDLTGLYSWTPRDISKARIRGNVRFDACPVSSYIRLAKPMSLMDNPVGSTLWCTTSFAVMNSNTWELNTAGYVRPAFQNATAGLRLMFDCNLYPNEAANGMYGDYTAYAIPYLGGGTWGKTLDTAGVMHRGYIQAHHQSDALSTSSRYGSIMGIPRIVVYGTQAQPEPIFDKAFIGTVTYTTLPIFYKYEVV